MKKLLVNILILLPLLFGTAKMGAQVTIGADDAPHSFSVLELVAKYKASPDAFGGLRLPQMTTDERNSLTGLSDPEAFGLTIYNTDINCVQFWNSVKWISFCEGETPPTPPEKDESGAYSINGKACIDVVMSDMEAPCMDKAARTSFTLTDPATQSFDYIFKNPTGEPYDDLTFSVIDPSNLIATETFDGIDKFTITFVSNTRNLAEGLNKDYALKVKIIATFTNNNNDKVYVPLEISIQDCSCGCPVKKSETEWLTFMCYNMGADPNMSIQEQMAYSSTDTDTTVYGWLYQWGRKADGHQRRSPQNNYPTNDNTSECSNVSGTAFDDNGQVVSTHAAYTKFIKVDCYPGGTGDWRDPQEDNLWNHTTALGQANNPCPSGWRVPTQQDWTDVRNNNYIEDSFTTTTGTRGIEIRPNGAPTPTTLFLPAGGGRSFLNGALSGAGAGGDYWSSSVPGISANCLYFSGGYYVSPGDSSRKANGYSLRCVADE